MLLKKKAHRFFPPSPPPPQKPKKTTFLFLRSGPQARGRRLRQRPCHLDPRGRRCRVQGDPRRAPGRPRARQRDQGKGGNIFFSKPIFPFPPDSSLKLLRPSKLKKQKNNSKVDDRPPARRRGRRRGRGRRASHRDGKDPPHAERRGPRPFDRHGGRRRPRRCPGEGDQGGAVELFRVWRAQQFDHLPEV